MRSRDWPTFIEDIKAYTSSVIFIEYDGLTTSPRTRPEDIPAGALADTEIAEVFRTVPPFGPDALFPTPPPPLTRPPLPPEGPVPDVVRDLVDRADAATREIEETGAKRQRTYQGVTTHLAQMYKSYLQGSEEAVADMVALNLARQYLPEPLRKCRVVNVHIVDRICLCTFDLPDFTQLEIVKEGARNRWLPVSAAQKRKATELLLFGLPIRVAYIAASSDAGNHFDIVAVNAVQKWNDQATGQPREGVVASVQASKEALLQLHLEQLDPKACFRHLRGVATPSIESLSIVRPVFVLNKDDGRIIQSRDVASGMEVESNLAAMPWDDFEHLVRQLFEWEFGKDGVEVKVTRASRDRGVDAIMFDPDPLKGGKFVLQAKRYTRTVDVAAVRDLYGTIMNEGANRGILVTTSTYGPDAYEFAKGKPISLVDGPNLIALLEKHGQHFKIDLAEARQIGASEESES